ncbi:hypothetical protein Y032_0003g1534 [Ancylostoma ceylanicum]|uniref:Uncharacterized protein n=1 Tax=Ancylostoma ceylanicum TaxID=53326 RepID=A0A016VXM9_9BILA|nr:hypothetical protein Y032_0003g1534 [Ancylostoma ceylanicum]
MTAFKTLDETTMSGPKKKRSICCGGVVVIPVFAPAEGIQLIVEEGVISLYRPIFLEAFVIGILAKCSRPVK